MWTKMMGDVWRVTGQGWGLTLKQWKQEVDKKIWEKELIERAEERVRHISLLYYPKQNTREAESRVLRTNQGRVVTRLRLGDRLLLDKYIGVTCPLCTREVEQATPHILGICGGGQERKS